MNRRYEPLLWICLIGTALVSSFLYLGLDLGGLLRGDSPSQMADYATSFFPPEMSPDWLTQISWGAVETLAISAIGTILAVLAGAALSLLAAGRMGITAKSLARLLLNALRSVPELVWAALMVLAAGLGPFAGTLAIALHTTGVLGRLFAEALENAPPEPAKALRDQGAGPTAAFFYGTLPQIFPQWLAYSLYRWENNIRMAAVLGFVGAGGLGQMLYVTLSLFQQPKALSVILAMIVMVLVVDGLSGWWRARLG
ncbi:phosphonate ABC transporter, permease protein PhnE [Halopseudomonas pelagia]|uniref:Phosphonate ABC transporter, permease protein PhnE n=1 Tax=Halopseudomonas pelagia TaxID=553151 RepID=A0AA91TYX8_9GAMM|nr:phosphonate ABC transporter, permease protein PhnE [Halopseudomonas pelagia]PCC97568.1 phosphonate ABC transporter, permease protein PhnE [Halopseudomonas pelagia]QFY57883.1 phosphonate ABC transporter, permease protein PhnE [Halopseudomonas pelagia]